MFASKIKFSVAMTIGAHNLITGERSAGSFCDLFLKENPKTAVEMCKEIYFICLQQIELENIWR